MLKIEYAIDRFAMETNRQLDGEGLGLRRRRAHERAGLQRWEDLLLERRASSQLHERHEASDFDTRTQDKLAPAT